jgi:A/G-specific adenine glycosylase
MKRATKPVPSVGEFSPRKRQAIVGALLGWFAQNARDLPWRRTLDPYAIWISEIMLQQTQMETVLPYFERWMKAFPDVHALARAGESRVLKLWQGLGYYSRARNLHAGAREIAGKFGGEFPSDYETVLGLKGIGRYTAGAICSIAFNQPRPIVDGNVLRVLARVYAIDRPIDVPKNREAFWRLEEKLIPEGRAREFNQALMELGALVCTPRNPRCGRCPLRTDCAARSSGNPEAYPVRGARKKTVRVSAAALAVQKDGAYLLMRRPVGAIMGGLWEFPEWKLGDGPVRAARLRELARRELGLTVSGVKKLGSVRRNYTHHLETLEVFAAQAGGNGVKTREGWKSAWAGPPEFEKYPFSSAHAKIAGWLTRDA